MYQRTEYSVPVVAGSPDEAGANPGGGRRRPGAFAGAVLASRSERMQRVLGTIERIARAQATVLIQGESGTGKEVFARALHERSHRAGKPFVKVNCAALPEGLLESELFGHERGAFTGATRQRPGKFEAAHGGSLFLDEIGAAEAKVQLRLLRVLQEREFERLGGVQTIRVDVRVIAATNTDLEQAVANGGFREDLYYRLDVVPLLLPPLRERREDIPLFVDHFVHRAALRNGCPTPTIDAEAMSCLCAYSWPGNVRQLENTVERMVVLCSGDRIRPADIPRQVRLGPQATPDDWTAARTFQEARARFERTFLCDALERHRGVISQVADAIGMSRKNLYMKLDSLDIDYERYRV